MNINTGLTGYLELNGRPMQNRTRALLPAEQTALNVTLRGNGDDLSNSCKPQLITSTTRSWVTFSLLF